MRRGLGLLLLALLFWMALPGQVAVGEELLPRTLLNLDPARKPLFEQYPVWAYTVETTASEGAIRQLHHLLNGLNLGKAWVLKLALRACEYAVAWSVPEALVNASSDAMNALGRLVWEGDLSPLVGAALALAALAGMLLAGFLGQGRAAWGQVLRVAAVVVVAALTLENMSASLRTAVQVSAGLNRTLYGAVAPLGAPATVRAPDRVQWALTSSADAAWRSFVLYPWAVQEFGSLESAARFERNGVPGGQLLERTVSQRMDWYWGQPMPVKTADLAWWAEEAMPRRLTVAAGSAAGAFLYAGAMLLVAGGVVVNQLLLLLMIALLPLVLLVALAPGIGPAMFRRWALSLLRILIGQAVWVTLLGVTVPFILVISGLERTVGWQVVLFLLTALAAGLIAARRSLRLHAGRPAPHMRPPQTAGGSGADRAEGWPARIRRWTQGERQPVDPGHPVDLPEAVAAAQQTRPEAAEAIAREMAVVRTRMLIAQAEGSGQARPRGLPAGAGGSVPGQVNAPHQTAAVGAAVMLSRSQVGAVDVGSEGGTGASMRESGSALRPSALPPATRFPRR